MVIKFHGPPDEDDDSLSETSSIEEIDNPTRLKRYGMFIPEFEFPPSRPVRPGEKVPDGKTSKVKAPDGKVSEGEGPDGEVSEGEAPELDEWYPILTQPGHPLHVPRLELLSLKPPSQPLFLPRFPECPRSIKPSPLERAIRSTIAFQIYTEDAVTHDTYDDEMLESEFLAMPYLKPEVKLLKIHPELEMSLIRNGAVRIIDRKLYWNLI